MCLNAEHPRMEGSDLKQTNEQPGGREKSCHPRQVLFPNLTVQLGWNHTPNTLQPGCGWSHLPTSLCVHNALSSGKILQITNVSHHHHLTFVSDQLNWFLLSIFMIIICCQAWQQSVEMALSTIFVLLYMAKSSSR